MNRLSVGLLLCVLFVCVSVRLSDAGAWLLDPPGRSALWNYGIQAPVNNNFRNLNCGREPVQIQSNGTKNCGICGDAVTDQLPRANENGGKYYPSTILSRHFEVGQTAKVNVWNDLPNAQGYYEFRLCPDGDNPTQACLDQHLLTIVDAGNQTYIPVLKIAGLMTLHVRLPLYVTCEHCMLQWRYRTENSFEGCDANNWCGVGRGPQIEYYNCADVAIGAAGAPKPDTIQDPNFGPGVDPVGHSASATQNPGSVVTTPVASALASTQRPVTRPALPTSASKPVVVTSASPAAVTNNPVLTIQPRTVTTAASQITNSSGSTPAMAAIVIVDAGTGNAINTDTIGTSSSRSISSRQLLLLLGLLPVLGAMGLKNSKPQIPAAGPGFWVQTPTLSQYYMGTRVGYGNLGTPIAGNVGQLLGKTGYSGSMLANNGNSFGTSQGSQGQIGLAWSNANFGQKIGQKTTKHLNVNNIGSNIGINTFGNHGSVIPSELNGIQHSVQRLAINGHIGNQFGTQNVPLPLDNNAKNTFQSPTVFQTSGNHIFNGNSANLLSMGNGFHQGSDVTDKWRINSAGEYVPNNGVNWGSTMQTSPDGNFNNFDNQMYPQPIQHNSWNNNGNANHNSVSIGTSHHNTGRNGNAWQGNNGRHISNTNNMNMMNTNAGQLFQSQTDSRSFQGQGDILSNPSFMNNNNIQNWKRNNVNSNTNSQVFTGQQQMDSMSFPGQGQFSNHPIGNNVIQQWNTNNVNTNTNRGGQLFPGQQQAVVHQFEGEGQIFPNPSVTNRMQPTSQTHGTQINPGLWWNSNTRVNTDHHSGSTSRAGPKTSRVPQVHDLYYQLINSSGNQRGNQHPRQQTGEGGIPQRAM